jgi:hypothetical protein
MVCKSVKDWIVDFGRWVLWCKVWVCRWHTLVLIMVPSWFWRHNKAHVTFSFFPIDGNERDGLRE